MSKVKQIHSVLFVDLWAIWAVLGHSWPFGLLGPLWAIFVNSWPLGFMKLVRPQNSLSFFTYPLTYCLIEGRPLNKYQLNADI